MIYSWYLYSTITIILQRGQTSIYRIVWRTHTQHHILFELLSWVLSTPRWRRTVSVALEDGLLCKYVQYDWLSCLPNLPKAVLHMMPAEYDCWHCRLLGSRQRFYLANSVVSYCSSSFLFDKWSAVLKNRSWISLWYLCKCSWGASWLSKVNA